MAMDNFLIIKLSSLGDIIHTLPAYSALRGKFPQAQITWLVEDKGKEILDLVPGLDKIITIRTQNWRSGLKKLWAELVRLRKELRNKKGIALDFQGLIKSGFFAWLSGAERRLGFHKKNLKEPVASLFYTERLYEIPEDNHVIGKNLELLTSLGIKEGKFDFPLVIPNELSESVKSGLKKIGFELPEKIILINVGAAWETKRWFPQRWIELIEKLKSSFNNGFFLLLWGNEIEKTLAEEIKEKTCIPLAPDLSLKEVVALIKEASLVVSGDTFALQAACALSIPVVGLFGPTNPYRNGPFDQEDKITFHELSCSFCYKRKCSNLECLKKITPEEVERQILQRLGERF